VTGAATSGGGGQEPAVTARRCLAIAGLALILGGTGMAATLVGPVSAQNAEEVRLPFSPVGIARGQTAVLSVVLVAPPPEPVPGHTELLRLAGQVLGPREEPAMTQVTLEEPDVTASFELPEVQARGEEQVRARSSRRCRRLGRLRCGWPAGSASGLAGSCIEAIEALASGVR
jgi:hypothetical protein